MHAVHETITNTMIYIPDMEQVRSDHQVQTNAFPFWAKIWPSAIAMGLLLQERPELVARKTVLELAGGLGLPSIIAAKHAAEVICSDVFPEPLEFVKATTRYHHLNNVECRVIDFRNIPTEIKPGVVLLSDVNYDVTLLVELESTIRSLLGKGIHIILSTPQRIVARSFINSLLPFCVEQIEKQVGDTFVHLYILQDRF
jgi:predicted nicotinamide N-methyase